MKYFCKIKYLGTDFHGFQVQPNKRTVQGVLCEALKAALKCEVKVTGCSRTDSGVHANGFCITVSAEGATVPPEKLPIAVCRFLPNDLSLFYAKECDEDFHVRYDVKEKEYLYRIINSPIYDPFEFGRAAFISRPITDLGIKRMNEAAKYFLGSHDFSAFMAEGSDVEDRVRTVKSLSVVKKDALIEIRISADGFLYNMVRIIVGTLLDVAYKRKEPEEIKDIISSLDRSKAGMTAPAEGLYLDTVTY
ncbi:MAG: tRNA pseudouridine(38-40) synthase TruA [Clostridia bacterium]|nr:tRNA pseudouridine(38-40) synthase TruA [Clostridia bacterium]